jgi:hypothetical protein
MSQPARKQPVSKSKALHSCCALQGLKIRFLRRDVEAVPFAWSLCLRLLSSHVISLRQDVYGVVSFQIQSDQSSVNLFE